MKKKFSDLIQFWKNPNAVTGIIFFICSSYAYLFLSNVSPLFTFDPEPELNLSKAKWEICFVPNAFTSECNYSEIKVPSDIPKSQMSEFKDWAIYRVKFTAPETCLGSLNSCAFFFEEIGDAAEAKVNGQIIGRHGNFPPHAVYSKHYPAQFQVSRDLLRSGEFTNELQILIYSSKRVQVGIRQKPIGLYSTENANKLSRRYTTLNVINPLFAFIGLFMIALFSLTASKTDLIKEPSYIAFIRYVFVTSCFLISISEVPREYLPVWLAGFMHFILRISSDWTFFELIGKFYPYKESFLKRIRVLYGLSVMTFFGEFLYFAVQNSNNLGEAAHGFDVGFTTLKIIVPLIVLPHVMGLYANVKRLKTSEGKAFFSLFLITFIFQIHDSAIFQGFGSGVYFVKWYPFLIGFVFGVFFLERLNVARGKMQVAQDQMKQMRMIHEATVGVAHDLEEPLKGLEMACLELSRNPDNKELIQSMAKVFPNKVQKIFELNRAILNYSKELSKPIDVKLAPINVYDFLRSIVDEFEEQALFKNVYLELSVSNKNLIIFADERLLRRVVRNLIRNAGEAVSQVVNPQVKVAAKQFVPLSRRVDLTISDNGPGIAPEIRDRLFQPFESFGKENGTGLGLAMSKRLVEAQGGTLEIIETEHTNFRVRI